MAEGVVTWFNPERGYGFITTLACSPGEGRVGDRVQVNATDIQTNGYKTLDEGEPVSYAVERDRAGSPVARVVTRLGGELSGYLLDAYRTVQAAQRTAPPADQAPRAPRRREGTEHYVFKSGRITVLERGLRWDAGAEADPVELDRRAAHCAVRGLTSLCDRLIRPMSFGVTRQWVNTEFGYPLGRAGRSGKPPRWNWFVTTPHAPPSVDSMYVDPQVMEPVALDERSMMALVDRALDDPCTAPDGEHVEWDELRVDHTWARLPEPHPDRYLENGEPRIDDVRMALDRTRDGLWVTAPSLGVWHPFMLRAYKPFGTSHPDVDELDEVICVEITVNWSLWWEPGEGRAMLDRALDRLLRQGWRDISAE